MSESWRMRVERLEDPPIAKKLFGDVRFSWIWLLLRLYLAYEWLVAAQAKVGNPVWTGDKAGVALTGFVQGALSKTGGEHPDVQGWYAWFLQQVVLPNAGVFGYLVTLGELLVGLALLVGLFTGLAAFFSCFMNANYLLAGTVSINPGMFILAILLVLAWKTAGWIGLDQWVLPNLGTPWSPGPVLKRWGEVRKGYLPSTREVPTVAPLSGENPPPASSDGTKEPGPR